METPSLLAALDMVAFESEDGVRFTAFSVLPEDLGQRFPQLRGSSVELGKAFPFLDHFLVDAQQYWDDDTRPVPLRSGAWTEADRTGKRVLLEATAVRMERKRVLLLSFLGGEGEGLHAILQAAREHSLAYERLEKAQRALAESEERNRKLAADLEQRVKERTADLLETNQKLIAYQERLRSLASELTFAEERERRKLAQDLHDHIGQGLAHTKIKLGQLASGEIADEAKDEILALREVIETTIDTTRSLTFELASPTLYELGLEEALQALLIRFEKESKIPTSFRDDRRTKPIDENVRLVLYQSVRELLHNIVKHARASSVSVTTSREEGCFVLCVEDEGVGFEVRSGDFRVTSSGGFGLFNIRERMDHLGGKLTVDSEVGRGTRMTLTAPLRKEPS